MTATSDQISQADEAVTGQTPDGRAYIRFERWLAHPVGDVWLALIEPDRMTDWLAHRVEIDPRIGGRLALWLGGLDESSVHESVITRFEPPHVLEADSEEQGTILWELRPSGTGTALTFVHTLNPGQRAANSIIAGWHIRMEDFKAVFDGRAVDWHVREGTRDENGVVARIAEIYWHYRKKPR